MISKLNAFGGWTRKLNFAALALFTAGRLVIPVIAEPTNPPPAAVTDAVIQEVDPKAAAEAALRSWSRVPEILARINPPVFPAREFPITDYGAKGDGETDCTTAFVNAIDACNKAGGGKVVVPAGVFLSGAIHLKSNVNLYLARESTIRFSTNRDLFLPVVFTRFECTEVMNYSPLIYAFEQENIAITGEGTLDGQGFAWHHMSRTGDTAKLVQMGKDNVPVSERVFGAGHSLRPNFVQPMRCRNVLIEGIHLTNSPMWVLHPLYSTNVTVRNVTVSTLGPNTDGCDPDSCTDVLIKDCDFSDGDDCISVKSGRDFDGRRVNIPSENMVIQGCTFRAGHGGVALGSETSGGIRNVFVENCSFDSTNLDMAMRFKTNPARGGYVEDIYFRNCTVKTAKFGIHMTLRYQSNGAMDGPTVPIMKNIDIRDSTFDQLSQAPIFIQGYSDAIKITDVTIANCAFPVTKTQNTITNAARISLVDNRSNKPE